MKYTCAVTSDSFAFVEHIPLEEYCESAIHLASAEYKLPMLRMIQPVGDRWRDHTAEGNEYVVSGIDHRWTIVAEGLTVGQTVSSPHAKVAARKALSVVVESLRLASPDLADYISPNMFWRALSFGFAKRWPHMLLNEPDEWQIDQPERGRLIIEAFGLIHLVPPFALESK